MTGPTSDFRTDDDREAAAQGQQVDARVTGRDGGPHDSEDMAAADGLTASPQVAQAYRETLERGAALHGEGAV